MKKYVLVLLILLACNPKDGHEEQNVVVADDVPAYEEWMVYEGVVRSDAGNDIKIELSLLQGVVGAVSKYKTQEEYIGVGKEKLLTTSMGDYHILYGTGDDLLINIPTNKGYSFGWLGSSYGMGTAKIDSDLMEKAKISKLTFKTGRNSNELTMVDDHSMPMANDDRYTLKKRSHLFTVEGFVTIEPQVTDFFEINTRENWPVSKAGSYGEVEEKYIELAAERHEGIYTKAVAYYIDDSDSTGREFKSLVIKRIVEMKSHSEFTRVKNTNQ